MRILVIFTGGTIGSSVNSDGFFSPDKKKGYLLLDLYKKYCASTQSVVLKEMAADVVFDTLEPYTTLSENLNGGHVEKLVHCVKKQVQQDYDGIIVTHGTDTLQYSAAALGYGLGNDTIPVVLVSSNYILEDSRANGLANFVAAVAFIYQKSGRGVFVSYKNEGECTRFHRGTRLLAHPIYSDVVYSVDDLYYGSLEQSRIVLNKKYTEQADQMEPGQIEWIRAGWKGGHSGVLWLQPYPGMIYPPLDDSVKAILFSSYHSGTLCTESAQWLGLVKTAKEKGIPVFLTGALQGASYESVRPYKENDVKILPKAASIAMYMKLAAGVAAGEKLEEFMNKSLGGDLL